MGAGAGKLQLPTQVSFAQVTRCEETIPGGNLAPGTLLVSSVHINQLVEASRAPAHCTVSLPPSRFGSPGQQAASYPDAFNLNLEWFALELTLYIQDRPKINREPLEGEVEGDSRLHTHFPR